MKKEIRNLFGVKNRQAFGYHKYPLNFLRTKPDFLIIGSQKAATTTMHHHLSRHDDLQASIVKEINYFNMNWERGAQYYKSCFPFKKKNSLTFETTPDYIDHPLAPKLCHQTLPDIKLVVTLREPVERAFSHFNFVQGYSDQEKEITFEQGLELEEARMEEAIALLDSDRYNSARVFGNYGYRRKGEYATHLNNWLEYYPLENFHFIEFNDIRNDIDAVLGKLYDFLEIPGKKVKLKKKFNKTAYQSPIKEETRTSLAQHYKDHNQRLFELISLEFDW